MVTRRGEREASVGAKTALLVYTDQHPADLLRQRPELDRDATSALVAATHPGWTGTASSTESLPDCVYPPDGVVYAGSFPGIDVLCDQQVMVDRPSSELAGHLLAPGTGRKTILHVMHSVVDWFGYAIWEDGALLRSLSVAPDAGIVEDIGPPLPFEAPFWAGEHPATAAPSRSAYPLPFHPLDLGEAALRDLLGFVTEDQPLDSDIDASAVHLAGFEVPGANPVTQADIDEFIRTHTRTRYRFGPDGSLIPIEE